MKNVYIIFCIIFLSACSGSPGSTPASVNLAGFQPPVVTPAAAPVVQNQVAEQQKISVTFFTLTKTVAPINGWPYKTVTYSGSCLIYLNKTYCWDDGTKTIAAWSYNNNLYQAESFNFWGLTVSNSSWGPCSGGCGASYMAQPKVIASSLAINISPDAIKDVFNLGASNQASCSENDGVLDCGDFKVNL